MFRDSMPLLFAAFLAMGMVQAQEPEPAMYSTSMGTATTTPAPVHTVEMKVGLSDVNAIANQAELISSIQTSMAAAAGGGGGVTVNVTIQHVEVKSTFTVPTIDKDSLIVAFSNMTGIPKEKVTINGEFHSSVSGGRRLQQTANMAGKVVAAPGVDVVALTKTALQSSSASAMVSALQAANPTQYGSLSTSSLTMTPISTELAVTTVVTGGASAPTTSSITSSLSIPGGANVTSASVTTVVHTTTTQPMESGAPILSLIMGWFACSFLLMA